MIKPLIGITFDWVKTGTYSQYPWYALRQHYADAISSAGGVPIVLPYDETAIERYADILDGLLITGGNFDVDPQYYGQSIKSDKILTIPQRTAFEFKITQALLANNKPILGICGGHQLLNVIAGGTLIQHIPDVIENALAHEQPNPRHEVSHHINVVADTKLYAMLNIKSFPVNSAHHQAVAALAPDFIVNAVAEDGVIEGIEKQGHKFCMGVQWHPEFLITPQDQQIFNAFISAC